MGERNWIVRFSIRAENDLFDIVGWTSERFGKMQAAKYQKLIRAAAQELKSGLKARGIRRHDEFRPGLMSLHIARAGLHGRHIIVFQQLPQHERCFLILRILHDSMDIAQHIPPTE